MNSYLSIIASDLKNTRRDPTLLLIFWVPFLILAVVRFGIPVLISYLPMANEYSEIIVVVFALLNAIFPGFVLAFILLDEKDLMLLPVIKVTPVSISGFLAARILFMIVFGGLGSLILMLFNGIIDFSYKQIIGLSILCALNVPLLILLVSSLAKNKVEGLTLLKVTNVTLFIPSIVFFFDKPWENIFALFPAFWVFKFVDSGYSYPILFIGTIVLLSYNYLAFRYALKRLY